MNSWRFMSQLLVLVIIIHIQAPQATAKARSLVGVIKEVKGAPDVLRNPQPEVSDKLKKNSKTKGYTIVLYKKRYWEAYPLKPGLKIYHGDVLSSGNNSKMVLKLKDGFQIIMAKNTKVRITPRFIKEDSSSGSWLNLISGKLRAYLKSERKNSSKTYFRSKTMAMGVRGTDFVFSVKDKKSQLVTIEGEVAARQISPEESQAFEKTAQAYVDQKPEILSKESAALKKVPKEKPVAVTRGQKVEATEPPSPKELQKLESILGAEQAAAAVKSAAVFKVQAAANTDLVALKDITSDIKEFKKDNAEGEKDLEKLIAEDKKAPRPVKELSPIWRPISLRFGGENLTATNQNTKVEIRGGGLSLGVDYRPFKYGFFSATFTTGTWELDTQQSNNMYVFENPHVLNDSYNHMSLGGGLRYVMMDSLSLGLALTYIGEREVIYEQSPGSYVSVEFDSITVVRIEVAYNVWRDMEIYLSMGGGTGTAYVNNFGSNSPNFDFKQEYDLNYFKVGASWNF